MKKIFCIIFAIIYSASSFAQENSEPYIKEYKHKEYFYFDSLNTVLSREIDYLSGSYEVYATFKIDTIGNIVDLKLTELPVCKLNPVTQAYIESLLKSTNGKWEPQIKSKQKIISDEIIYRIYIEKANQSIAEATKAGEEIFKYTNVEVGDKDPIIYKFDRSKRRVTISIRYHSTKEKKPSGK